MPLGAQLVLMLLFGAAGVHHARHLERKYGRSAWGWPSWAWGLVAGFSLLIGAILLAVAERQLKRDATPSVPLQPAFGSVLPGAAPAGHGAVPVAATEALAAYGALPAGTPGHAAYATAPGIEGQAAYGVGPEGMGEHPVYGAVPVAPTAPAPAAPAVPAGWQPDPSGRHQLRWWDGHAWTASVHSNGVTSTEA